MNRENIMNAKKHYLSLPAEKLVSLLDEYCGLQSRTLSDPDKGNATSALTALFNGMSYRSASLIRAVAEKLDVKLEQGNPHQFLAAIADAAEQKGFGPVTGIRALVATKNKINDAFAALETRPSNVISKALVKMELAKR